MDPQSRLLIDGVLRQGNKCLWSALIQAGVPTLDEDDGVDNEIHFVTDMPPSLDDGLMAWQQWLIHMDYQFYKLSHATMLPVGTYDQYDRQRARPDVQRVISYRVLIPDDLMDLQEDRSLVLSFSGRSIELHNPHDDAHQFDPDEPYTTFTATPLMDLDQDTRAMNTGLNTMRDIRLTIIDDPWMRQMNKQRRALREPLMQAAIYALMRGNAQIWSYAPIVDPAMTKFWITESHFTHMRHHVLVQHARQEEQDLTRTLVAVCQYLQQRLDVPIAWDAPPKVVLSMYQYANEGSDRLQRHVMIISSQRVEYYRASDDGSGGGGQMQRMQDLDLSPWIGLSSKLYEQPVAVDSMMLINEVSVKDIVSKSSRWRLLHDGNALMLVIYDEDMEVVASKQLMQLVKPDEVRTSSELIMMMLLYGAYYAEMQENHAYTLYQTSDVEVAGKLTWAYVWQNTVFMFGIDQVEEHHLFDMVGFCSNYVNDPSFRSTVFDLGDRPYRLWESRWIDRQLKSMRKPRPNDKMMLGLKTNFWRSMLEVMQSTPDRASTNAMIMDKMRRYMTDAWVHVLMTHDESTQIHRMDASNSAVIVLPSWLGQVARHLMRVEPVMVVDRWFETNDGTRLMNVLHDFDMLPSNMYLERLPWLQKDQYRAILLLMEQHPVRILSWPSSNDPDWPRRIMGLADDLKLTFSLSNLLDADMRFLINEAVQLQTFATVQYVELNRNMLGLPMIYPENQDSNPMTMMSLAPGQGWLIKAPRSLSNYALFVQSPRNQLNVLVSKNDVLRWMIVDEDVLQDFFQRVMQGAMTRWMNDYWVDRTSVVANLFYLARQYDRVAYDVAPKSVSSSSSKASSSSSASRMTLRSRKR